MKQMLRALGSFLAALGILAMDDPTPARAQCTYTTLSSGVAVTAGTTPQPCSLNQSAQYWTAVAVRSAPGDNWDLEVDQSTGAFPACVATLLGSSSRTSGVDFVIGDFNPGHDALAVYYPRVARVSGTSSAAVEWDSGSNSLTVNGPLLTRSTGASDVIEVWDAFLSAGSAYTFTFTHTAAGAKLLLFKSGALTYWAGRNGALFEVAANTTYTASATGYYGVVVINDDGAAGTYSLGVGRCETPTVLGSGVATSTAGFAERYYSFDQAATFWTAVGVRGSADWNLEAYASSSGGGYPTCLGGQAAGSSLAAPAVDFVVGNFNNMLPAEHYARVHMNQDQGSGSAMVEWDSGSTLDDIVITDGPPIHRTTGSSDVLECWDVYLDAGATYQVLFNSTGADCKLFLFGPGVGWAGRGAAILQRTGSPSYVPYVAASTGWHGLVVVNDNGQPGTYDLQINQGVVAVGDGPLPPTQLQGVAPNPARGPLQIHFALHDPGPVAFDVLDVAGRVVSEVPTREWSPGRWTVGWIGQARNGGRMSAGVYFLRMRASGRTVAVRKFTLMD